MTKVFKYVLKYKGTLIFGTISMLIVIGVDLLIPYMQQIFIDDGIIAGNEKSIFFVLGAILVISVIKAIFGYNKEFKYDLLSTWVHQDIKNDLFTHIQKLEFKYFDEMNTGELMSRIGEDAENIWQTIGYGLRLFVENIIYFVISTIILFSLNWKLALACFIVMIPIGFIAVQLEKKFGKCYGEISDKTAEINTTAQEDIAGIRLVKAFSREKYEISKFLKLNKSYYDLNMNQAKVIGNYFPKIEFLSNISLVIMIVLGGYLVMNEEMTVGVLVAFSGYIWNLIWPMRMLGELTDLISRNLASAKKIFAIIEREPEIKSGLSNDTNIKGDIKFENVSFSYNDELVLKNINLDIKAGNIPTTPITMIFGAKAAPAYIIAQDIIHTILCLQEIINNDPVVSKHLKVVMVENYNVTKASKLIPACDVSEQISLASKEASGTGNMKFMLNGALTLGTEDGANVEIHELVGDDNIYIFGESSEQVIEHYKKADYVSRKYYEKENIKELVDFIVSDEMLKVGDEVNLNRLHNELIVKDWFMTLLDIEDYIKTKNQVFEDYSDRETWNRKVLINISKAGFFSSDRTIAQYNEDIWKLK